MSYFYFVAREKRGPISGSELKKLAAAGEIGPTTLVEMPGKGLVQASRIADLKFNEPGPVVPTMDPFAPPPPPPVSLAFETPINLAQTVVVGTPEPAKEPQQPVWEYKVGGEYRTATKEELLGLIAKNEIHRLTWIRKDGVERRAEHFGELEPSFPRDMIDAAISMSDSLSTIHGAMTMFIVVAALFTLGIALIAFIPYFIWYSFTNQAIIALRDCGVKMRSMRTAAADQTELLTEIRDLLRSRE